uniref:Uncharacterized protein n=1 Tax=Anopheles arabiensis TaxID=7173 RepID=A0A182IHM6_ANOAR
RAKFAWLVLFRRLRSFCWALDLRRLATRSALLAHGGFDGGLKQGTNCSNNLFR